MGAKIEPYGTSIRFIVQGGADLLLGINYFHRMYSIMEIRSKSVVLFKNDSISTKGRLRSQNIPVGLWCLFFHVDFLLSHVD